MEDIKYLKEDFIETDKIYSVFDKHYGVSENTGLYVLRKNSKFKDVVGFDRHNYILEVILVDGVLQFNNSTTYGQLVNGKLEGWCFDREGTTIDGYESSGYYKER